jgi:hypothetical protein
MHNNSLTNRTGRPSSTPPVTGPSSGSGEPVGRSNTDLARRQARLEHAGLEGRGPSGRQEGSLPPRGSLPPLPQLDRQRLGDASSLLDTRERSDRFQQSGRSDIWSNVDLHSERDDSVHHEEEAAPTPPPERSWRNLASSVLGQLGATGTAAAAWAAPRYQAMSATVAHATQAAYGAVRNQTAQSAEALGLLLPNKRLAGALVGHLAHQSVTVGVPTFLREMMAEAMVLSMRHMPPDHAAGLQVAMAVISVGAQVLREQREKRNPDTAARGFHGLSSQQWNELSGDTQATLRKAQRNHSRMITLMQITASGTHIAIGAMAAKADDTEKAGKLFATDFKTMVYGGMRDSLQASFSMVGTQHDTHGVGGAHMTASAMFYGGANIAANYAFTVLPSMVPNAQLADDVLRGKSDALAHGDAWLAKAGVSAVKASINTILEAADWFSVTQQEANQAGTVQRLDPKLKLSDYGRLLDQTPARMVAIGGSNAMYNAITFAMKDQPQATQDLVANVVVGAFAGVQYKTIGGTWQADGAVRAEPVPAQPRASP